MKFFVTGVGGQLGHDVMNELAERGIEGIGSDIAPEYSGIADGTAVTKMPYIQMDITDEKAVSAKIKEVHPDVVVHCAAWTAVDLAEDEDKVAKVRAINADGTRTRPYANRYTNQHQTCHPAWIAQGSHAVLHVRLLPP